MISMKLLSKIDIHVHTTPEALIYRPDGTTFATPEELRWMYDQLGVEKAVLLPSITEISNREARNLVREYPNVFGWWFCNLSPYGMENDPTFDWVPTLKNYQKHGARGIGELTENIYFDDPLMMNLFSAAEKVGMPVTFHIGNKGCDYGVVDDLGLPHLENALKAFPNLTFLGHSQKFWAEIGQTDEESRKGYPTGKVVPGRVVELMRKYPNLNGDLSAGSGCNALMRDPEFAYTFIEEFQDRLFYGTDICDPANITDSRVLLAGFLDNAVQAGKISYTAYEKISRGNALKLLEK